MMENSSFIRIYYSTDNIILNGLFLHLPSLEELILLEKDILDSYTTTKKQSFTIGKQYKPKHVKISGLWESETSYGIVFKFI